MPTCSRTHVTRPAGTLIGDPMKRAAQRPLKACIELRWKFGVRESVQLPEGMTNAQKTYFSHIFPNSRCCCICSDWKNCSMWSRHSSMAVSFLGPAPRIVSPPRAEGFNLACEDAVAASICETTFSSYLPPDIRRLVETANKILCMRIACLPFFRFPSLLPHKCSPSKENSNCERYNPNTGSRH